jgi:DNA repair photolyase
MRNERASEQLELWGSPAPEPNIPQTFGGATVSVSDSTAILTKASGFMASYDFTINPYSGCTFGCSYCYAAFFARSQQQRDDWGHWVTVKTRALETICKKASSLAGKSIYLSSVTDPYQPLEQRLGVTRDIVAILAEAGARLVVQTRSPLVTRDLDLFKKFAHIQVNMTITTDDEAVRKAFEPGCPGISNRIKAISEVAAAGVPACITMTPLLPVRDAATFAQALLETGVKRFVVQPFHATGNTRFVRGTREGAMATITELNWTPGKYAEVVAELKERLPALSEGREGFSPI